MTRHKFDLNVKEFLPCGERRWKGTNYPIIFAVNAGPTAVSTFHKTLYALNYFHFFFSQCWADNSSLLHFNSTVQQVLQGWIQYFYLYLQMSQKWILVESTCLNPLAKNILHIVNMAILNTVSILKYFHVMITFVIPEIEFIHIGELLAMVVYFTMEGYI